MTSDELPCVLQKPGHHLLLKLSHRLHILPRSKLTPDLRNPFQHPVRLQLNASVECFSCNSAGFLDLAGQDVARSEIREGKRPPFNLVLPELVQTVAQRRDRDGREPEPR